MAENWLFLPWQWIHTKCLHHEVVPSLHTPVVLGNNSAKWKERNFPEESPTWPFRRSRAWGKELVAAAGRSPWLQTPTAAAWEGSIRALPTLRCSLVAGKAVPGLCLATHEPAQFSLGEQRSCPDLPAHKLFPQHRSSNYSAASLLRWALQLGWETCTENASPSALEPARLSPRGPALSSQDIKMSKQKLRIWGSFWFVNYRQQDLCCNSQSRFLSSFLPRRRWGHVKFNHNLRPKIQEPGHEGTGEWNTSWCTCSCAAFSPALQCVCLEARYGRDTVKTGSCEPAVISSGHILFCCLALDF